MQTILTSLGITPAEFVVQLFVFLILIWFLNRYLSRPILGVISQRQNEIRETYDQLDNDRRAMERARSEYEQRLIGIEEQARERIQAAVKEAQELSASIVAEARRTAETTVDNGRADVERERARAFAELRQQVADLAITAATKVVGESMDGERQRHLVNQFIAGIADDPARASASSSASASSNGAGANGAYPAGAV